MPKRGMRASSRIFNAKLTPLEEAEFYQQRLATAIEEGKPLTAGELAQQIGKNENYVRFRLRLLDAIPPVKASQGEESPSAMRLKSSGFHPMFRPSC